MIRYSKHKLMKKTTIRVYCNLMRLSLSLIKLCIICKAIYKSLAISIRTGNNAIRKIHITFCAEDCSEST